MRVKFRLTACITGLMRIGKITAANSERACWLPDGKGRYFLPFGHVTVTGDKDLPMRYSADDYRRMVCRGANRQVVRLMLDKLGGWPEYRLQEEYLQQINEMVRLAQDAGTVRDIHRRKPPLSGWVHRTLQRENCFHLRIGKWHVGWKYG